MQFFGTQISPHISRTPEGYLLVAGVPLARTAVNTPQLYRERELGLSGDELIEVWRSKSEVFDKKFLASLESKPITDNHPSQFLSPDNFHWYAKGHVRNIRAGGVVDGEYVLLGDLVITDRVLAEKVLSGVQRQVSVGYDTEYHARSDGSYEQRKLRANHVAVVGMSRCGKSCSIQDSSAHTTPAEDFVSAARVFHRKNPSEVAARSQTKHANDCSSALLRGDPQSWDELAEQHQRLLNGEENMAKKSSDEQSGLIAALKLLLAQLETQGSESESDEEAELISSADSSPESIALAHLRNMRPMIERGGNRATIDAFNSAVRAVKSKMHARALVTDARSSSRSFLRSESFTERVSRVRSEENVGRSFEEAAANARAKMLGKPTPEAASRAADSSHADEDWASAHRRAGEEMRNAKR